MRARCQTPRLPVDRHRSAAALPSGPFPRITSTLESSLRPKSIFLKNKLYNYTSCSFKSVMFYPPPTSPRETQHDPRSPGLINPKSSRGPADFPFQPRLRAPATRAALTVRNGPFWADLSIDPHSHTAILKYHTRPNTQTFNLNRHVFHTGNLRCLDWGVANKLRH